MRYQTSKLCVRAVTLTELLVVLAIIGLLATIAIPVYVNRVEQAKIRTAQQETEEISKAEEICGISHGFYIPLQMLDDLPAPSNVSSTAKDDDITQENDLYLIDLTLLVSDQRTGYQPRISDRTINQKVANLYNHWLGPFLNPQRTYTGTSFSNDPNSINNTTIHLDYPMDPWGIPYRFYSSEGIIGTNANQDTNVSATSMDNYSFSDGRITNTDDRFDRFAIVSFGPDRITDPSGDPAPDDIIYFFGISVTESTYQALRAIP